MLVYCYERGESLNADADDIVYEPSEAEDDEADGDGDDYPQDGLTGELDELEKEDVENALSPSEDPPPPPDPPTQSTADDPDSKPQDIPIWVLILLLMFSTTAFSMLVKRLSDRLCRALGHVKAYAGSSISNIVIYLEELSGRHDALGQSIFRLRRLLAWDTGLSVVDLLVYVEDSAAGYRALAGPVMILPLASTVESVALLQPEDLNTVRRAVESSRTTTFKSLILRAVLGVTSALLVSGVFIFIDLCLHMREGDNDINEVVILLYQFPLFDHSPNYVLF